MIVIKNMNMPENCSNCPFEIQYGCGFGCNLIDDDSKIYKTRESKRMDDCPLIECVDYIKMIATTIAVAECDETSATKCFECINKIKNEVLFKTEEGVDE